MPLLHTTRSHNHYGINQKVHIQIQIHKPANKGGLFCFRYEGFINFWLRFFDTKRERDTQFLKVFRNHTILTPTPNVWHISWCLRSQFISAGRDPKNSTLWLNGRIPNYSTPWHNGRELNCLPPISTLNWLFFKILQFSGPSLPGMTSSTLQPHFLSGVYYEKGIVISIAHERKSAPHDYA